MEDLKQHYLDEMLSLKLQQLEQADKLSTYTTEPSQRFIYFYDDDDEGSSIPLRDIISKLPPSIAITPVLPTLEPEDSLIMGNEELSTILEKESDEFIKSSVEDLVPIPSESEDTSGSDSECDLPSCDDFSPIKVYEEKSMTFSNPLFDSNDDFTSSDDESLSDKDVLEENVKIYSNPLFEFDDEYISSAVNPLFDEVLENIESKASYDSNLDEPAVLVTPLSDSNEDECFTPSDDVELLLHRDSSTPMISVVSILEGFTDEPPLEENDDLFDLESKGNEWMKILYDAPIDDLMTEDKIPSGESKVHIEVLSVLWENRLLDHGRLTYRCGSCCREASRLCLAVQASSNHCRPINQSLDHGFEPLDHFVYTLGLPSWQIKLRLLCASLLSGLAQKSIYTCAFTIADVSFLESEVLRSLDLTNLSLASCLGAHELTAVQRIENEAKTIQGSRMGYAVQGDWWIGNLTAANDEVR
ncbi:hypothetical protein Tco_0983602, partial [Tanacetum coccineum]